MRTTLLFFCLIAVLINAKAQNRTSLKPIIMVDSITVPHNIMDFLDANEIQAVDVQKNADYPDGIIYITMKNHQAFLDMLNAKMLSLNDLKNTYVSAADRKKPIIYLMNNKLLTDTAGIRIPATHYHKVDVIKGNDTPYFKTVLPNILIVMISTVMMIK